MVCRTVHGVTLLSSSERARALWNAALMDTTGLPSLRTTGSLRGSRTFVIPACRSLRPSITPNSSGRRSVEVKSPARRT
jgi:hypothetical protein